MHFSNHPFCNIGRDVQSWSELLAPLVNMIKEGSENKPALLILLIFYLNKITKIQPFIELKQLKMAENLIMKSNVFLKYTLDTIIGNPRVKYLWSIFNSIQFKIICSAFHETIIAKQLYRKLRFYNRFIYCKNLIYLTYDKMWIILYIVWGGWHHLFSGVRSSQII